MKTNVPGAENCPKLETFFGYDLFAVASLSMIIAALAILIILVLLVKLSNAKRRYTIAEEVSTNQAIAIESMVLFLKANKLNRLYVKISNKVKHTLNSPSELYEKIESLQPIIQNGKEKIQEEDEKTAEEVAKVEENVTTGDDDNK